MKPVNIPDGVWPVMLTAFKEDKSIDWGGVDALTDWYIENGAAGLFAVSQSSEMYELSNEERLQLATRVIKRADGRLPVIASGTFGDSLEEMAGFIHKIADTGVRAVVVIASQLAAQDEGDDVWCAHAEKLLRLTGDIPLGIYECPAPYHRLLSPETIGWAARTGRFFFLKETSRSMQAVRDKIAAASGTPFGFFNADATGLLETLRSGGKGYSGIAANFYPDLIAWLCAHFDDSVERAARVQQIICMGDAAIHIKYPVCAKYYLQRVGLPIGTTCRRTDAQLHERDRRILDDFVDYMKGFTP